MRQGAALSEEPHVAEQPISPCYPWDRNLETRYQRRWGKGRGESGGSLVRAPVDEEHELLRV